MGNFSVSIREHPEKPGEPYHELSFGLGRDFALREYDDWGKQLKQELAQQPDVIEVDQHVHMLMESIRQINQVFAKDELANLRPGAIHIDELAKRVGYRETDYELGIYELEVEQNDQGETKKPLGFHGSRIPMDVVYASINDDVRQFFATRTPA